MAIDSKDINQKPVSGTPDTEPKFPDSSKSNDPSSENKREGETREQRRPIDRAREHAPDDTFPGSGPGH